MQTNETHFSDVAKFLHWLIAALIISQYGLANLAEYAQYKGRPLEQLVILANHKSVGITILALALIRLGYRLYNSPPLLPTELPHHQKLAASVSHFLLYGFLFALPITGWFMSSAKAFTVSWFNLFAIPDLVSPNEWLADQMLTAHYFLSNALFVIALIHVAAALKHHFIDKDTVLIRISDRRSWLIFGVMTILTTFVFGRFLETGSNSTTSQPKTNQQISLSDSDLPIWVIDYSDSFIKFKGDQAGAPFSGEWQRWDANIQFESNKLDDSRFYVSIDSSSAFSNDQDRDDTIRSPEFFDTIQFPSLLFLAEIFTVTKDNGYIAQGQLTMKGASSPAKLHFNVTKDGNKQVLTGTATLDRLTWNIGIGEWADTSWVGQYVTVSVRVVRVVNSK